MRKVAVVTPGILPVPPVLGGSVETVVYDYARHNSRDSFTIFSVQGDGLPTQNRDIYGIEHIHVANRAWHNLELLWRGDYLLRYSLYIKRVCRQLAKLQPEIVHLHNRPDFVLPIRRALGSSAKLILTNHNTKIAESAYIRRKIGRYR